MRLEVPYNIFEYYPTPLIIKGSDTFECPEAAKFQNMFVLRYYNDLNYSLPGSVCFRPRMLLPLLYGVKRVLKILVISPGLEGLGPNCITL